MNLAVSGASARVHNDHARPANFGQLNSAIARGDLTAAKTAFTAISESSAPAAMAAKAKGSLEAVGSAIASGDIEGAKNSLADFRAGRIAQPEVAPTPEPTPDTEPNSEVFPLPSEATASTEQILALMSGSGSTETTLS